MKWLINYLRSIPTWDSNDMNEYLGIRPSGKAMARYNQGGLQTLQNYRRAMITECGSWSVDL